MTRTDELRARLLGHRPTDRLWGWLGPAAIAVVGGVLRFWNLDRPHALVFDETYYVKQGYSLLRFGVEMRVLDSLKKPDDAFTGGNPNVFSTVNGDMVVHPPVGKWVIAAGEGLLGVDSGWGWRFSVALLGTLSILVVGRAARRMFGSTALGCVAAFLIAFEGSHFVMSRTGILDLVVMFFALCGFAALLVDRDRSREILAVKVGALPRGTWPQGGGPWLGWRPWRWAAGLSLGLCTGTKWSGLFFVAAFGLLTVWWDMGARRAAGIRRWGQGSLLMDGPWAALALVGTTVVVYVLSWTGWFLTDISRTSATTAGGTPSIPARGSSGCLRSCATGSSTTRTRTGSTPRSRRRIPMSRTRGPGSCRPGPRPSTTRGWPGARTAAPSSSAPRRSTPSARSRCGGWPCSRCSSSPGGGWCAATGGRVPSFTFYAVAFEPWVVLAVTFVLGLWVGRREDDPERWRRRWLVVGGYLVLTLALFAFFHPVYVAETIPYDQWRWRMWFPSWI